VRPSRLPAERSVAVVAVQTFGLKLALVAIGTIASVVVSRILGPEGRGIYYTPVIAAATVVAFAKLGLEQANVYLYASRSIPADRLAAQSALVAVIGGGAGMLVMFVVPAVLPTVFGDVAPLLLFLGALTIPLALHTQFVAGLQNLVGQVTLQFRAAIVAGLVQLAALLALAFAQLVTVTAVLAINLAGAVLAWLWTLRTSVVSARSVVWDPTLMRESIRQSLVLHLGLVLFFLHLRVDMFMVKAIDGAAALGVYSLAVVLAETVLLVTDSVSIALLPRQITNTIHESARVALGAARVNGYIAVLFGAALVMTGWILIPVVFGAGFSNTYPALVALVPGIVFVSMQRVCGAPVLRAGVPWRITAIYAVSLAVNVILNLVWIPRFGPVGASLASSVSYGLAAALFLAWTSALAGSAAHLWPSRSDGLLVGRALALASRVIRRKPTEAAGL
jgi:O-antigen/teichoic acid export membrane protein